MSDRQRMFEGFEDGSPEPVRDVTSPRKLDSPAANSERSTSQDRPSDQIASTLPSESGTANSLPDVESEFSLKGKTVWVVDAHSLIYQVFHAMQDMTGPAGQPIGAVHGFTRDIADLLEKQQPDFLFCAFDHPGETFRHEEFPAYKEKRPPMPDDLRRQIQDIHRMLQALGLATLTLPRYEADDILATLARQTELLGGECVLVTNDKDCRQLITGRVSLFHIRKNQKFSVAALEADWGIRPDQVVDFQSLVGDSVDQIPGVPLIGPKIAGALLQKYGDLETVFASVDEIAGKKRRENLRKYSDQALRSRRLVRLVDDLPIDLDWQAARPGRGNRQEVLSLCREFGFRRLGERLTEVVPTVEKAWVGNYSVVKDSAELTKLGERLRSLPALSIHVLGSHDHPRFARCLGIAVCWQSGQAQYVPCTKLDELDYDLGEVWEQLGPVLADPQVRKIGHDLKHQQIVLRGEGQTLRGLAFDPMVADYLLAPGERRHEIEDLARRYFQHVLPPQPKKPQPKQVEQAALGQLAGQHADLSWRLFPYLDKQLAQESLQQLLVETELPLLEVLAELEFNGIYVDVDRLGAMSRKFDARLDVLRQEIAVAAGCEFNIDSRLQLAQVLFEDLKLPVVKRTKTGPSTDAEVLEQLAADHPLPAKILEYRQIAKLKSTYVDALPELVHPLTQRVHTSFKQDVAATGRLSSQDPNLQNIPIRSDLGRAIRSAFLAQKHLARQQLDQLGQASSESEHSDPTDDPPWLLLTADYSQIELRVLAHFTRDASLVRAFEEDIDIHQLVASEIYGVSLADVTTEMRRNAKTVNFGVIYGQTSFGLAKQLGIEKEEAAEFIDAYFSRYGGVDDFIAKTLEDSRRKGYVSTILGRRRTVEGIRDSSRRRDSRHRNQAERIAINTVIQGSAADLIKRAMIEIGHRMRQSKWRARMLLQIHDELVFEFPSPERDELARLVTHEMVAAGTQDSSRLSVPLKVDVKSGPTWADCEPLS